MATTIPCSVDTAPMAAGIQSVSNQVKGTTAAVVTMQGAVIEAENRSANKVCSNVNRGFFTLIRSQISQKIANRQSRVEALIMRLGQQKRLLLGIKANMEREYGRIAERYIRIFTSINKELESRIRQVDQPVFELVNKHMTTSSNRMNALTAWASTSQVEGLTQSQHILVSKMKNNAQIALEESADFLSKIGEQRVLTNQVLISQREGNDDRMCQVPVMIVETINDVAGIPRIDISIPARLSEANVSMIDDVIRRGEPMPWKQKEVSPMVSEEFLRIMESSDMSSRVKDMIRNMYMSADFETL